VDVTFSNINVNEQYHDQAKQIIYYQIQVGTDTKQNPAWSEIGGASKLVGQAVKKDSDQ